MATNTVKCVILICRSLAAIAWAGICALLLLLPVLLLCNAHTLGGRFAGLASFCAVLALLALCGLCFRKLWKIAVLVSAAIGVLALFSLIVCVAAAPNGKTAGGNFSQHFSGEAKFSRLAISNLVPEEDQLLLGTALLPYCEPLLTSKQGRHLSAMIREIYGEMNKDSSFRNAGSALGLCYEDIFSGKRRLLHYYEYIPRSPNAQKHPTLIFLHGSLGNFRAYSWLLKSVADSTGFAVIAPSYGCGNWYLDKEGAVMSQIEARIKASPELDASSVYIAGLSNGGFGVARELKRNGNLYKGCILISAVPDFDTIATADFASKTSSLPFLSMHGLKDDRISCDDAKSYAYTLRRQNKEIKFIAYPDEDHFLFFSKRKEILDTISNWLVSVQERKH